MDEVRTKGRRIAITAGVVALAVLVLTGFALRGRVLEEWFIWKLKHGSEEEKSAAIEELGLLRSERAATLIVEGMRGLVRSSPFTLSYFMEDQKEAFLKRSIVRIGGACDLALIEASLDKSRSVSALAATCLEEIHGYGIDQNGGVPRFEILTLPPDCVYQDIEPVLRTLAEDVRADLEIRRAAATALTKVQADKKS
jgi:hypothetical protein